jgi:hypothetical protein
MVRNVDLRSSFRCAVAPEDGAAQLKVNGKLHDCQVTNTSREGFGIRIRRKVGRKINQRTRMVLLYRNEKWEVTKIWDFQDNDVDIAIGLERVRELSKLKPPKSSGLNIMPRISANTDPSFLLALLIAFMLTCLCLPGIGDNLGTAPKVRSGVNSMLDYVRDTFN